MTGKIVPIRQYCKTHFITFLTYCLSAKNKQGHLPFRKNERYQKKTCSAEPLIRAYVKKVSIVEKLLKCKRYGIIRHFLCDCNLKVAEQAAINAERLVTFMSSAVTGEITPIKDQNDVEISTNGKHVHVTAYHAYIGDDVIIGVIKSTYWTLAMKKCVLVTRS